jgi:hypothetical protein
MNKHRRNLTMAAAAGLVALAFMPVAASGADAPASAKEKPVKLEAVAGSSFKRVTLTARAAERLGIATGAVGMMDIPHTRMLGGLVLPVPPAPDPLVPVSASLSGGAAPSPAAAAEALAPGRAWISVTMSEGDLDGLAVDQPARIRILSDSSAAGGLIAIPSKLKPVFDPKRLMLTLHYVVQDAKHGLQPLQRVLVELQMADHGARRTVVPTSAVFYAANGDAAVYVKQAPLTYMRESIAVARVVGDVTVLAKGPPVGTPIVTVGAAMLFGTEVYGK